MPTKYHITYSVPVPTKRTKSPHGYGRSYACFPFPEMLKGGSFIVTDRTASQLRAAATAWSSRWNLKNKGRTRKFLVRQTETGARVWRTK